MPSFSKLRKSYRCAGHRQVSLSTERPAGPRAAVCADTEFRLAYRIASATEAADLFQLGANAGALIEVVSPGLGSVRSDARHPESRRRNNQGSYAMSRHSGSY